MASYAEQITGSRNTSVASPTVEKLKTYMQERAGALLFELPSIGDLRYARGLHNLTDEQNSYGSIFKEKPTEVQLPFVVAKIFSTLGMVTRAIEDNPGYFSDEFHKGVGALQEAVDAVIIQSDQAVSRGFMPALLQIHQKETAPRKGPGSYLEHKGRINLDTFRRDKQEYIRPLYDMLDTLQSSIEALPKKTSRDTALANYLCDSTLMAKDILKETDRLIRGKLEPEQNMPSR